jgi:malate dehydrogenase (oxaloacetate-decarboxylating)
MTYDFYYLIIIYMSLYDDSLRLHEQYKGKLAVHSKMPLETRYDLSTAYSPGVAQPCLEIAKDPANAYRYTWKGNSVAVVSDGTAVLGLGNLGGLASLPVMEGKCVLFKAFGDVDAVPVVLNTSNPDEIIKIVQAISPTYWGINLEDISAPNCFIIEEALQDLCDIPIFHDDQHGTAIVVLAALINALKVREDVKKLSNNCIKDVKIVVMGAGAAWIAVVKLLWYYGFPHIITVDSKGAIYSRRSDGMNKWKEEISIHNIHNEQGNLEEVIQGADVFVGLSGQKDAVSFEMIQSMNDKPIIFATSNPEPEVHPEVAKSAWAFIIATGRSDYPNQINNVLAFPGVFRGILDARIPNIRNEHKIAAAIALADYVTDPTVDMILPNPLDKKVAMVVAEAVKSVE